MNSYRKHLVSSISFLILLSCSSESTGEIAQIKAPIDPSSQASISENSDTIKEFELASNELEYQVIQLYEKKFSNKQLSSVVNGKVSAVDPGLHTIYLEGTLSTKEQSLSFFKDKYPEFIEETKDDHSSLDLLLLNNSKINSKEFTTIKADSFIKDRSIDNSGNLLLILSRAFDYNNAYFVHVWEISNGKGLFSTQRKTYKFNSKQQLIDSSFMNYSFNSYSKASRFLERLF